MRRPVASALLALFFLFPDLPAQAAAGPNPPAGIPIGWLGLAPATPPRPSETESLAAPPSDDGVAGLALAVADDNSSGRFVNQHFTLEREILSADATPGAGVERALDEALRRLADGGVHFVVADLPRTLLLRAADSLAGSGMLFFNAGAADDSLRVGDCRRNLLHTIASRAMAADALAQFLIRKNWKAWLLVVGPQPGDEAYAAAVRRAARKFGGRISGEKRWTYTRDSRRTAAAEVSAMTQEGNYDVVVVADEAGDFGDLFPFNTWDPRPVAGTQGLTAGIWHPAHGQWGATQLQNRFHAQSGRDMTDRDMAAWEAGRAVGEAALKTRSSDPGRLTAAIRAEDFTLAAYKGRNLSFRPWSGQLRQPMLIGWPRAVVSVSPQEGFLHPLTDLDTLGFDKGESRCSM